jgi:hypothetical protein
VIARYVLLGAAVGIPAGLLWVMLAPRVLVSHDNTAAFVDAYPQGFAIADLTLGLLLLFAGVGLGMVGAGRLRRTCFDRGWAQVVGVLVASLMAGAVARVIGWWLAGRAMKPVGSNIELPLTVQADGVLLLGAFSALIIVVLYSAFARDEVGENRIDSSELGA